MINFYFHKTLYNISVQFTCSVMSDSLQSHGLQHTRLPCPSPSPGACSNSRTLSRWCHPTTSSSVTPFSLLQSFPASGSYPVSLLFASGGKVLELQLQHQSFQWIFRGADYHPVDLSEIFAASLTAAHQASLSITNSWSLLKLMPIESVMPSNHLILCPPLLLPPSIFPSVRVFSNESVLHVRWPNYWSFSFSISPSNEYSRLISFRMDWVDLLTVQGTLKSILHHDSSKASIIRHSAFFIVQLSHPYINTGETKPWLDGPLLAK